MRILLLSLFVIATQFSFSQNKRNIVLPDGHSLLVKAILHDKQEKFMYTAESHKCIMWDIKTGKQLYTFKYVGGDGDVHLSVTEKGDKLALLANGIVRLYNTLTGTLLSETKGYPRYSDVCFINNDILLGASDGIRFLDASNLAELAYIKSDVSYKGRIWSLGDKKIVLANTKKWEVYDLADKGKISSHDYGGNFYATINFLPQQQQLVLNSNRAPIDFFDINTGKLTGSIKGDFYDPAIIPSANTHEILITGPQVNGGAYALDLYGTDDYKLKARYNNTTVLTYHSTSDGYFDGRQKKAWLVGYNLIGQYDLTAKNTTKMYNGVAAQLGMDVFNAIEYNYATGTLHLTTDDHNLKSVDLLRMVPILHTDLKINPTGLAVSPTGDTAAIFGDNTATIKDVRTGKLLKPSSNIGVTGFLYRGAFFFSNDGKTVYYPSDAKNGLSLNKITATAAAPQKVFSVRGFGPLEVSPDKKLLAGFESAYQFNEASVWDLTTGQKIFSKEMPTDGEYDEQYMRVSQDKQRVLISKNRSIYIYSLADKSLLKKAENVNYIDKFGSAAANNSLTVFVTGTQTGRLDGYNTDGRQLYSFQAHTSTIRKIVFSPDDKLFYTISYDNTVKVWDAATGKFIGVLYLFKDSNDYVFMDADGRFDGSPAGIKQIYYVLNRQSLPLDALFEKYYTPNLYARLVAGEQLSPIDVNDIAPIPKVRMTYAAATRNLEVDDDKPTYQNNTGYAEITIDAEAENDSVDEIRLFHNGKIVTLTTRNLIVEDDKKVNRATKKYTVNLLPGVNAFSAVALNSQRTESKPDELDVIYKTGNASNTPAPANNSSSPLSTVDQNATLHLIVIGINEYQNKSMSLNYALADATAFKTEMEKDAKTVIKNIQTYFVTDAQANKDGIEKAFSTVQQRARPEDVFVFYYAGHGVIGKDNEFYLVPNNVSDLKNVQAELEQKAIAAKQMQRYAIDIKAQKQLFILDACQSAGAFESMLSNDANQQKNIAVVARSTGTHWMAASGAQQFANEFSSLGHGAFTYVLLQALNGAAFANNMITVNNLKNYLQQTVPELMKKYHGTPQYPSSYGYGNDFPVVLKK